jgi:hypothetical protein
MLTAGCGGCGQAAASTRAAAGSAKNTKTVPPERAGKKAIVHIRVAYRGKEEKKEARKKI